MTLRGSLRVVVTALSVLASACSTSGGGGGTPGTGGTSGGGTAGDSGTAGTTGAGGTIGSAGTTGAGGDATGTAGTTGAAGTTAGSAGTSGTAGTTGTGGGSAGTSGTAGTTGTAGRGGTTGAAGRGGTTGTAGTTGTGGSSGTGGTSTTNACTGTASSTPANTLTVNADSAQYVINSGIFGVLMEILGRNWRGGLFVGTSSTIPNTNGMRNDVIDAFKEAGVGMIQWPGGCAAGSYNWNANRNPSNDVGTDRYMQLCALLGIPPAITGPGTSAAAAQNLAWVQYINANTTHPEWTLNWFQVGNEVWGCGGSQDEATYEANFVANYNMLSTPVNGKKLNLIAGTDLIGRWPWLDTLLKNQASKIDAIEIHDYIYHPDDIPNVGFSDAQYYNIVHAANKGQIGPRIDQIVSYLDKYDSAKRIKIWEGEWGNWLQNFTSADDWLQQGTLLDAISGAETLHLFMQHADRYVMAGLAQGINVIQSLLLTRSSDSALVKTPSFYLFKMFLPHHRANAKWAPSTLTSENITGNGQTFPVLSAGSSVDDQGRVNISLANVDLVNTRSIRVTINSSRSAYTVSAAQVITGPAKDSYNDYAQTEKVNIQTLAGTSCSISGKTLQVTLPSKSVVMLVLTPTS